MEKLRVVWYRYPSSWMKRLYKWVVHWADTPFAVPAIFFLAVAESSFFPIPPDVLLIALSFSAPTRSFFFATVCSAGSILGGLGGYAIGFFLWEAVGRFFLTHVFSPEIFDLVTAKYQLHSFWIVFTAAFTPIPYKVFTITAGVCHVNLFGFFVASLIGRSMRFFLVATILYFFGQRAKKIIEKYFEWVTLGFAILLILGFILIKKIL